MLRVIWKTPERLFREIPNLDPYFIICWHLSMSIAIPHMVVDRIQVEVSGFWHFLAFKFCLSFESPISF